MKYFVLLLFAFVVLECYSQAYKSKIKWPSNKISVCWEQSASSFVHEKEWVQNAIKQSWETYSGLEFINWCQCEDRMPGIHIAVEDTKNGVRVKSLGATLDKMSNGVILNFSLKNWGTELREKLKSRRATIEVLAIHEFGHALGFTHQQSRVDCYLCSETSEYFKKDTKDVKNISNTEGLWNTDCDEFSVMNYCSVDYANSGQLSDKDKSAVSFVYGPSKQIQEANNLFINYSATPIKKIEKYRNNAGQVIQADAYYYEVEKYRYYEVILNISGNRTIIEKILKVDYYLNTTFDVNKYSINDSSAKFLLKLAVWGNFNIKAKVFFKDSQRTQDLEVALEKIPPFKIIRINETSSPQGSKGSGRRQTRTN